MRRSFFVLPVSSFLILVAACAQQDMRRTGEAPTSESVQSFCDGKCSSDLRSDCKNDLTLYSVAYINGREDCGLETSCIDKWTRDASRSKDVTDRIRKICSVCVNQNGATPQPTSEDGCVDTFFASGAFGGQLAPFNDGEVARVLDECLAEYGEKPLFCAAT
ncbi:MAG: hypothetical protein U0169_03265 [Polyangiaceae bacterium]